MGSTSRTETLDESMTLGVLRPVVTLAIM